MNELLHRISRLPPFGFAAFVWRRFQKVRLMQVASSLTFTTLLALVPLLTVTLVVLTALPDFSGFQAALNSFITSLIVPSGAAAVADYLQGFREQAGQLTAVGVAFMAFSSLLLVQTIDETFNRIWNIQKPRPLLIALPIYVLLLTFGPVLVAVSLSASAYVFSPEYLDAHLPWLAGSLKQLGASQIPGRFLLDTLTLWLLYRVVPNCLVPAANALIGAALTAALLEAAKWGFAFYIANFNSYRLIYGAFSVVPVFLVWLHLLWLIVLFGALITACLPYCRRRAYLKTDGAQVLFDDAVYVLLVLWRAQGQGGLRQRDFRLHIAIGYDALANLLDELKRLGYIKTVRGRWQLKTDASEIMLDRLFAQFVYDPKHHPDGQIAAEMAGLLEPAVRALNISLREWGERNPPQ
jgi:UPF0761 membrane protein ASA_4118